MSPFPAEVKALTIPNGGTDSNVLTGKFDFSDAVSLTLYAPATLDALVFTFEITDDPDAASPVWRTFETNDPAEANPPGAGKARNYRELLSAAGLRIHSSAAVAAARVWAVSKQYQVF